jgi:ubiquinol-cytochrome c reductase cytochrome b subunit
LLKRLDDWIDARTGYRSALHEALDEPIPGGARLRYVFGSALTAVFLLQAVTGVLLMTTYSPSSTTAWGSVYFITYQLDFGWFVRGMHHFGAQAMIVLLGLHLLQVLVAGAYRAPREFNWWFGLKLMFVTLGLSLTGYLLPWDQKGYWATKVATNILSNVPLVGAGLQKIVLGGDEYGNQTLTRFYALHVAILPGLLILLLVFHIALFRKHGVTHPANTRGRLDTFWPKQVFLDTLAIVFVVGGLVAWVVWERTQNHAVPLDAPADPSSKGYEPRPEWYFLSLFQLLKRPEFSGKNLIIGTVVVPSAIVLVLSLLPFFDKLLPRRIAHFVACGFVFALVGGVGYLTWQALDEDAHNSEFLLSREHADAAAIRAKTLADEVGIAPEGAGYLLKRDPMWRGRVVLEESCLSCHYYNGRGQLSRSEIQVDQKQRDAVTAIPNISAVPTQVLKALAVAHPNFIPNANTARKQGPDTSPTAYIFVGTNDRKEQLTVSVDAEGDRVTSNSGTPQTASDLHHFGSASWLRGLLEKPDDRRYFGAANFQGGSGMKRWKKDSKLSGKELDEIADFFNRFVINTPEDLPASEWSERENVTSHPAFKNFQENGECFLCHSDWVAANPEAPNLFGWGSPWWVRRMIERPGAPHFYGFLDKADQMPAFSSGKLTSSDLQALVRFLKDDYLGAEPSPEVGGAAPRPTSPR